MDSPGSNENFMVVEKEGILYVNYKENLYLDLSIAKESVLEAKEIAKDRLMPALIDITNVKDSSYEARNYLVSQESYSHISCCALIVKNKVAKIMATIYININKPPKTTKIFYSEDSAKEWLHSFNLKKL